MTFENNFNPDLGCHGQTRPRELFLIWQSPPITTKPANTMILCVLKRILHKKKSIFMQLLESPIPPLTAAALRMTICKRPVPLCHHLQEAGPSFWQPRKGHEKCIFETLHNEIKCVLSVKESNFNEKHCQRHNGPKGWVLLSKLTSLGHITSSNTNLDQTYSESRPCINFKISTKRHLFDKT